MEWDCGLSLFLLFRQECRCATVDCAAIQALEIENGPSRVGPPGRLEAVALPNMRFAAYSLIPYSEEDFGNVPHQRRKVQEFSGFPCHPGHSMSCGHLASLRRSTCSLLFWTFGGKPYIADMAPFSRGYRRHVGYLSRAVENKHASNASQIHTSSGPSFFLQSAHKLATCASVVFVSFASSCGWIFGFLRVVFTACPWLVPTRAPCELSSSGNLRAFVALCRLWRDQDNCNKGLLHDGISQPTLHSHRCFCVEIRGLWLNADILWHYLQ